MYLITNAHLTKKNWKKSQRKNLCGLKPLQNRRNFPMLNFPLSYFLLHFCLCLRHYPNSHHLQIKIKTRNKKLTLNEPNSCTLHVRNASLPTGTV